MPTPLALERDLAALLGLTVEIRFRGSGGSLVLHYSSLDQLDDILHRLSHGTHGRRHRRDRRLTAIVAGEAVAVPPAAARQLAEVEQGALAQQLLRRAGPLAVQLGLDDEHQRPRAAARQATASIWRRNCRLQRKNDRRLQPPTAWRADATSGHRRAGPAAAAAGAAPCARSTGMA